MTPTPGPVTDAAYQPGTPGAQWTDDEVSATRLRVLQMIHPNWDIKKDQGTWNGVGVKTEEVKNPFSDTDVTQTSLCRGKLQKIP